jgi:hypothetical protein
MGVRRLSYSLSFSPRFPCSSFDGSNPEISQLLPERDAGRKTQRTSAAIDRAARAPQASFKKTLGHARRPERDQQRVIHG